jgi:regulator of RNase E activity RraA
MYRIFDRKKTLPASVLQAYRAISPSGLGHLIEGGMMDPGIRPLQPGDIIVVDREGDTRYACWGEMTTLAASLAGAGGAIIDGPATDVQALRRQGMPVFARGASALTTQFLGLGGGINVPILCGGVTVHPGDLIFGDANGIFVIDPRDAERLLELAIVEEEGDMQWRNGLLNGKRPSQLAALDEMIAKANREVPVQKT